MMSGMRWLDFFYTTALASWPVRKLWPSPCRKNCSLFTLIQVLDTNNLLSKSLLRVLLNSVGWEYLGTEHSCDFCVYSGSVPTARASDGCSAPPVIFSAPSLAVEVRWDPLGSPRWLVAAEEAKTMQGRLSNYHCSCSSSIRSIHHAASA